MPGRPPRLIDAGHILSRSQVDVQQIHGRRLVHRGAELVVMGAELNYMTLVHSLLHGFVLRHLDAFICRVRPDFYTRHHHMHFVPYSSATMGRPARDYTNGDRRQHKSHKVRSIGLIW